MQSQCSDLKSGRLSGANYQNPRLQWAPPTPLGLQPWNLDYHHADYGILVHTNKAVNASRYAQTTLPTAKQRENNVRTANKTLNSFCACKISLLCWQTSTKQHLCVSQGLICQIFHSQKKSMVFLLFCQHNLCWFPLTAR